jgi:hypothetical protein
MLEAGSERMLAKDMGSFALTGFYVVKLVPGKRGVVCSASYLLRSRPDRWGCIALSSESVCAGIKLSFMFLHRRTN